MTAKTLLEMTMTISENNMRVSSDNDKLVSDSKDGFENTRLAITDSVDALVESGAIRPVIRDFAVAVLDAIQATGLEPDWLPQAGNIMVVAAHAEICAVIDASLEFQEERKALLN